MGTNSKSASQSFPSSAIISSLLSEAELPEPDDELEDELDEDLDDEPDDDDEVDEDEPVDELDDELEDELDDEFEDDDGISSPEAVSTVIFIPDDPSSGFIDITFDALTGVPI